MAAAITKTSPTAQLAKARAGAAMKRVAEEALKRRHTMAVGVAAAGIGFYEKGDSKGPRKLPSFIPGIPPKIQMAVVAALIADNSSGDTRQYAQAALDGLVAISGYQFGRGQDIGAELISGDDEIDV